MPRLHHRARHHREREHAGHEEVDRLALDRGDRVDLREEHEDAERDHERDEQALAAPQRQRELEPGLSGDRSASSSRAPATAPRARWRRRLGLLGEPQEHLFEARVAGAQLGRAAPVGRGATRSRSAIELGRGNAADHVLARPRLRSPGRAPRRAPAPSNGAAVVKRSVGSVTLPVTSVGVPSATMRPRSMIATRSQSCSASSM